MIQTDILSKLSKVNMRDALLDEIFNIASIDSRVILLVDDFGAIALDKFKKELRSQCFNVGIAEQNMVSIAAGLALGGKIVYIYGIAPFMTLRCYEQIKIDLCCMNLPVTCLGVGAGYAYDNAGPTHHAVEDIAVMRALPHMTILNPCDNVIAAAFASMTYKTPGPKYIRIDRGVFPLIYEDPEDDFSEGLTELKSGRDITIIATGTMVHRAFKISSQLSRFSIDAGIVDLYRIKPVNNELIMRILQQSKRIVTIEENLISGGIGSLIAEIMADNQNKAYLKRIAIPEQYCFKYGDREKLYDIYDLGINNVTDRIYQWVYQK